MPPLNIKVEKDYSPLFFKSGLVLCELATEKEMARLDYMIATNLCETEEATNALIRYKNKLGKKSTHISTKYIRPRNGFGRSRISGERGEQEGIGLTTIKRQARNSICYDSYYDIDMENAHYNILYQLIINHKTIFTNDYTSIYQYITDRDNKLQIVCEKYGCDRKLAKDLFTRLGYGGSIRSWKEEYYIENQSEDYEFITKLKNELSDVTKILMIHNPELLKVITDKSKKNDRPNIHGSFLALYLQQQEFIIIDHLGFFLSSIGLWKYKGKQYGTYEFDGVKILQEPINKHSSITEIISQAENFIKRNLNIDIPFISKPMEDRYLFDDVNLEVENNDEDGVTSDLDATKKLFKLYPHWKCCHDELYVFDEDIGIWKNNITSYYTIIQKYSEHLCLLVYDSSEKRFVKSSTSYGNSVTLMNKIPILMKTLCVDDNWLQRVELSSMKKLLFTDGYVTFDPIRFYSKEENGFNPDIVFFESTNRPFAPVIEEYEGRQEYINDIKNRLFTLPLGEVASNFLLNNIARKIIGCHDKDIIFNLGETGNNGKSILASILCKCFGGYVDSFNAECLTEKKYNDDEAKALRWLLLLRYKRLLISNELRNSNPLSAECLKKVSSGGKDAITGRMHGGNETSFIPHCGIMINANDLPPVDTTDRALQNRIRLIHFKKTFVENPSNEFELKIDYNLENEINTDKFQNAFISLIFDYYLHYTFTTIPQELIDNKKNWNLERVDSIEIFLDEFEITGNYSDYVESSSIQYLVENNKEVKMSYKKWCIEFKRYLTIKNINGVDNQVGKYINGKKVKCWIGLKRKEEELEEEN